MSLQHILLGMLSRPATGYELKAEFEAGARHFWSAELGQIYPTLQAMERKGWLKSQMQPSAKGPARRVYHRLPRGQRELQRWLKGEPIMGTERFAYLAQLIFHGELHDSQRTLQFVQQLRAKQAALLGVLERAQAEYAANHPGGECSMTDEQFHNLLCLQLGARAVAARVAWCDEAAQTIRRRAERENTKEKSAHV